MDVFDVPELGEFVHDVVFLCLFVESSYKHYPPLDGCRERRLEKGDGRMRESIGKQVTLIATAFKSYYCSKLTSHGTVLVVLVNTIIVTLLLWWYGFFREREMDPLEQHNLLKQLQTLTAKPSSFFLGGS